MALGLILVSAVLLLALFKIQILEHNEISEAAAGQYFSNTYYSPSRGDIFDRNGVKLAGTHYVYRVGVTPKHFYSRSKAVQTEEIVTFFCDTLGLERSKMEEALKDVEASYIQLAKDVPEEKGKALETYIQDKQIGGVRLDAEPRRYYTNGNLGSQVIGFASYDDKTLTGRLGVELAYDAELTGEPGFDYGARDNYMSHGRLPYSESLQKAGKNGHDILLTLDMNIQKILQDDLEAAIKAYNAVEDGMALCVNPYTGEIYGMASYPYFESQNPTAAPASKDPKKWDPSDEKTIDWLQQNVWRNKTISDLYEAGSTMKTLTAAIGMEENVCTEESYYSDDPIQVLDATISCVSGDGHGYETMEQGYWRSCNPVFVQISLALGIEKYYDYMHAFGFYESTGVGLPGEAQCIFHARPSILDLANLSFGESSSVTPLHLMRAFCALVNGGKLVTPHIIKEISDADGRILELPGPDVVRQVIAPETSARIRKLMRGMVQFSNGYTNSWGYAIGGKTSTSTDEITGKNTISFMGAGPIDHPEVLVLMILKKPDNPKIGGTEAEIVTLNATSKILDYLNFDRSYDSTDVYKMGRSIRVPDFTGYTVNQAGESMTFNHVPVVAGDDLTLADSKIKGQLPAPGTLIYPGTNIFVYKDSAPKIMVTIPDFSEMNYNEVIDSCNALGIVPQFEGNMMGCCVSQKVANPQNLPANSSGNPGEGIYRGQVIRIALELPPREAEMTGSELDQLPEADIHPQEDWPQNLPQAEPETADDDTAGQPGDNNSEIPAEEQNPESPAESQG